MQLYLGKIRNVPKEVKNFIHDTYGWWFCFIKIHGCPFVKYFHWNVETILREIVINFHWRTVGILIALYDE